ncbi:MAG: bifunctional diguanylate cyclase/phosphodiesterase [Eubacteriales bacterium]|nr:bifunctional diguanylate cyclase/phosphodiesterase [Eubacteriales bacterium]
MTKPIKRTAIILVVSFSFYAAAMVIKSSLLSDLLAVACDLLAVGIIFYAVYTSSNKQFSLNFLFVGFAIFSWAVADVLWLLYGQVFHIDPADSDLIAFFYSGTNVFLIFTTILYLIKRLKKWDTVQLILDAAFFSIAIIWLFWSILLNKDIETLRSIMNIGVIDSVCIMLDFFQILLISIWYMSVRKGRIPPFLRILTIVIFLFSLADLIYYSLYAQGQYTPDTLIDACYLATLFGLAFAVKLYYGADPLTYDNEGDAYSNVGHRKKGLLLLFCPVLIILFKGFDLFDIAFFIVLIFLHELNSWYIQTAIRNKELLQREVAMNSRLEQLVSERTCDLESANTELEQKYTELEFINIHDALTGLYNRRYFLERLEKDILHVSDGEKIALILWNMNNLKGINDTYGHITGDQIINLLGKRVNKTLGNTGLLARLDGDEFAYLMKGPFQDNEYENVAEQITSICKEPARIGIYVIHVTVSIGIALFPLDSLDALTLLKNAGIAMRFAKERSSGNHILQYNDVDAAMKREHQIQINLMKADYEREFTLHYQPQFRISDRKLIGMEALLRWNCPNLGPISPVEFIPIAERDNLIIPIGNWVIQNAVRQIASWNQTYQTDFRMGINISPKQLGQASTLAVLDAAVNRYKAVYQWIDIEITESIVLDNENNATQIKRHFGDKGITISIDDFGTGYSSLGYLSMLTFDKLKIAKPLIDQIVSDESHRKIVASIILLAKSLGLQVIAEGVETKQQLDLLLELGCDQIQGFYWGKPLPADDFANAFLLLECR